MVLGEERADQVAPASDWDPRRFKVDQTALSLP